MDFCPTLCCLADASARWAFAEACAGARARFSPEDIDLVQSQTPDQPRQHSTQANPNITSILCRKQTEIWGVPRGRALEAILEVKWHQLSIFQFRRRQNALGVADLDEPVQQVVSVAREGLLTLPREGQCLQEWQTLSSPARIPPLITTTALSDKGLCRRMSRCRQARVVRDDEIYWPNTRTAAG